MKLLLSALFILLNQITFSQKVGLGKLILDSTTIKFIDSLGTNNNEIIKYTRKDNSYDQYRRTFKDLKETKYIISVEKDTSNYPNEAFNSFYNKDVKSYVVNYLQIGNYGAYNVELLFYKNLLFSVSFQFDNEFLEALKIKFGEPEEEAKTKKSDCDDATKQEIQISYYWDKKVGKNYSLFAWQRLYYYQCEPNRTNTVCYYNNKINSLVTESERKYQDRRQEEERLRKVKGL